MRPGENTESQSGLTEAQLERVHQIKEAVEALETELHGMLKGAANPRGMIDLRFVGIDETQAADLRARLKTFAEDWERPEAAIYDEDPAR